ncbi:MAG: hypothetical protein BWX72_01346 [Firmicutes bacterium ADurb.Bin080]|jgi:hypothetical protein|nr:hypothetical protein [Clostridiales bacterium]OQC14542.1 MAG: hypothetical protein BWX72_01346 [Firmicutes bacterium ADurb.Bin080]
MKDKIQYLKDVYKYYETDNSYHVVIDLDTYRDIYSEWDYSPFNNRELDGSLLRYIMECSYEIGLKKNMALDFYVPDNIVSDEKEQKSIEGFRRYFNYQIRKIKSEMMDSLKKLFVLILVGTALLTAGNVINAVIPERIAAEIVSEGLIIGAWVAVWEIFHTLFFSVSDIFKKLKHYERLRRIPITYRIKK